MKNYENGISRRFCVSRKMPRKERGREGKRIIGKGAMRREI